MTNELSQKGCDSFSVAAMNSGPGWWPQADEHQQHRGKPPRPWPEIFPQISILERPRQFLSFGGTWSSESIISASDQRLKLGP